ncbi:MAG: type II toxin-antitoxin system PemK/MazF family toxin [Pseudanabaenaceae cyanobacterium]|jgi:mRNA interferase MazF
MAGQRPRHGWIYMVNPSVVSLSCHNGHQYLYDLSQPEVDCKHSGCNQKINPSRVFRGTHPYVIWSSDEFQDDTNHIRTFTVIPLTSQTTFAGLPTTYPITKTGTNGLTASTSYALVHQICTIDGNCFKDGMGNWLIRMGQLSANDKEEINRTLAYYLAFAPNASDDWFRKNASPQLVQKVYSYLSSAEKESLLETLLDKLD